MSMNNVDQAYAIAIQAGVPVMLWGPPGIGKTMKTHAIGRSLGRGVVELVCSTLDPTDVGLPVVDSDYNPLEGHLKEKGGRFVRVAPKWAHDCTDETILYLDEFSCTPPSVQASALKIVGERKCGDFKLPDGMAIAMSANPVDQAAGGWDLAPPMANRMVHLDCSLNTEEWCDGMIAGFPDQEPEKLGGNWEALIPSKRALVTAYIRRFPTHLLDLPEDEASQGKAWPSPRSWDFLCRVLAAAESIKASPAVITHLVKGSIGHPAVSFLTFCEQLDLPDPEVLLADPSLYEHPRRGDKAHAILGSVAAAAIAKPGAKRWEAAVKVMLTAADQGGTDIAAMACRSLFKNVPPKANVPDEIGQFFPMFEAAGLVKGGA